MAFMLGVPSRLFLSGKELSFLCLTGSLRVKFYLTSNSFTSGKTERTVLPHQLTRKDSQVKSKVLSPEIPALPPFQPSPLGPPSARWVSTPFYPQAFRESAGKSHPQASSQV